MATNQINTTTTDSDDLASALAAIDDAARAGRQAEEAAARIGQARIDLVLGRDAKAVFFATVAMRLRFEPAGPDDKIDTAVTNGRQVRYNPEFVAGLSRAEAMGWLAHEVLHVTNAHHARMGDRDQATWNEATDLAINPMLRSAGIPLPPPAIFPGEGKYTDLQADLSAEEYYTALQKGKQDQPEGGAGGAAGGDGGSNDPGGCGGVEQPGTGSPADVRRAEAEAKEMAAAAQQAAEASGRGDLPGGIGRAVRELLEPKADWRTILREFIARSAKNDYSWSRPNRRYIHAGLYLPGLHSEELGDVVLAVDVSGSINQETLTKFAAEAQGILEAYDCKLTIVYHDAVIQRVQEWRSTDGPLVLETCGGGGTSHVPVFDYIAREGLAPACVVALTDLYTAFPSSDLGYPTLWCNVEDNGQSAPFGRVVPIND